jgi:hypothetical protein
MCVCPASVLINKNACSSGCIHMKKNVVFIWYPSWHFIWHDKDWSSLRWKSAGKIPKFYIALVGSHIGGFRLCCRMRESSGSLTAAIRRRHLALIKSSRGVLNKFVHFAPQHANLSLRTRETCHFRISAADAYAPWDFGPLSSLLQSDRPDGFIAVCVYLLYWLSLRLCRFIIVVLIIIWLARENAQLIP